MANSSGLTLSQFPMDGGGDLSLRRLMSGSTQANPRLITLLLRWRSLSSFNLLKTASRSYKPKGVALMQEPCLSRRTRRCSEISSTISRTSPGTFQLIHTPFTLLTTCKANCSSTFQCPTSVRKDGIGSSRTRHGPSTPKLSGFVGPVAPAVSTKLGTGSLWSLERSRQMPHLYREMLLEVVPQNSARPCCHVLPPGQAWQQQADAGRDKEAAEAVRRLLGHKRRKPFTPDALPSLLAKTGEA